MHLFILMRLREHTVVGAAYTPVHVHELITFVIVLAVEHIVAYNSTDLLSMEE